MEGPAATVDWSRAAEGVWHDLKSEFRLMFMRVDTVARPEKTNGDMRLTAGCRMNLPSVGYRELP